ncbi:hypothetical protein D6833_08770, partial [Candidatus Parcubacteria bacterium]
RIRPKTLNIAGPRESQQPGIGDEVRKLLARVFKNRTGCGPV